MGVICVGVEMAPRIGDIEVTRVITGTEAIAKLSQRACDAVVVGPRVPDMPVGAIVDAIVRNSPGLPVVLVADAPRAGIWEHVPFVDERLDAAVRRAVEVGRLRRATSDPGRVSDDPEVEETFRRGTIRDMERLMIFDRLDRLAQNRTRSAASLEISVRTLRNKLREYRETGVLVTADREDR